MSHSQGFESRKTLLLGIALIILSGIVAGAILPLTNALAGYQDGDGILTSLISTQKLTWYFWGQDRLLNFIPALASPFSDVETNLRIQVFLRSFFAYLAPLGILIFLNRSPRFLIVAIAITNIIIISCLSRYGQFNFYVQHNTFGTSMVLFALAFALTYSTLPKAIIAVAALVICSVAYATNYALLTYSVPVITILGLLRWSDRNRYITFLAVNCLAILIARYHSKMFGEPSTSFGLAISFQGIIESLHIIRQNLNLVVFLVYVGITLFFYNVSTEKKLLELSALVCVGLGIIVLLANTLWLEMNAYNIRYFLTSELIIASVMGFVITRVLVLGNYKFVLAIPAVGLIACVFVSLGNFTHTYKELVGAPWRANSLAVAELAVDEKAQIITGGFWDVWPVVYDVKGLQPKQPVFGAAYRGGILRDEFLSSTKDKEDVVALCFYATADLCSKEISDNFKLSEGHQLLVKHVDPVTAGDKPLLRMVVEIN